MRIKKSAEPILFWGWVALLAWSVIPLGSNRPWAWGLLEAAVFLHAAVWLTVAALGWTKLSEPLRRAWPVLCILLLWLLYQALYFLPLPADGIGWLSPESLKMQQFADGLPGAPEWKTLAIDPYAAKVAWLKSLLYVLAFVMTLALTVTRERARQLAYAIVLAGMVVATYGVLMHVGRENIDWFGEPMVHGARALATFANADHFAGWLEMVLALGVGLLVADLRDRQAGTWKQLARHFIEWVLSPKMRLRLILCVLVIALVATRSRMGNGAFFASMFIAGIIGIALSRHATRGTVILLVSLIVIDTFIVGSWFGVEKLAQRLEQTTVEKSQRKSEESLEERTEAALYAVNLIKDYPAFGTGPGSWYSAYPRYRGADVIPFYDFAHNDYIQFTAESGVIGVTLLAAIVLASLIAALKAQYQRRDPLMRGLSFAAIMGIIAILMHSSVDFNLQIPANAMLFMVILAYAWISLHLDRRSPTQNNGD
ncbi:MAG: O-antigen ligase family protein [Betaproteobacteria bacterium]|nr:O-antigen ligase family protein [Betaproteobacteria bacterium]